MIIAARYPFRDGERYINGKYAHLLEEVRTVIHSIEASSHITKISREKTMVGRALYDPKALNKSFKQQFNQLGWDEVRIPCDYPRKYYVDGYNPRISSGGAFREMDFIKEKLGVEVQFGKYAFMVYNVAAKMTIFRNLGFIDSGLEIVPMKQFADRMSTGVSYFEQIAWDLEQRGVADIDVPALVIGIDA
jgi:hypothetical protein